ILLPLMPPNELICSTARSTAATLGSPGPFSGPAVTTMLPILMVFWAKAAPPSDISAVATNMVLSLMHDLLARMFRYACSIPIGGQAVSLAGGERRVPAAQIGFGQCLVARKRLCAVLEHDLAELEHIAARSNIQRHGGILLDQQNADARPVELDDQVEE